MQSRSPGISAVLSIAVVFGCVSCNKVKMESRAIKASLSKMPASKADCDATCWVGKGDDPGFLSVNQFIEARPVETPVSGQLNIQMMKSGYSVYNPHLGQWYSTGVTELSLPETSPVQFKAQLASIAYDTNPVKVTIRLFESTPGAKVYIDDREYGAVSEDGRFYASPGARPSGSAVLLDLSRANCLSDSRKLFVNPGDDGFEYRETIKLQCHHKQNTR